MHSTTSAKTMEERLQQARDLYLRARRTDAFALLHGCEDWQQPLAEQALALRAEIVTLRDPVAGLQELAAYQDAFVSSDARFEYALASARAYTNSRNFDAARAMIAAAAAPLNRDDARMSRIAYHRARLEVISNGDPDPNDFELAMRDPDPSIRFNALSWRAWMHIAADDFRSHIADLREALRLFETEGYRCNVTAVATSLHALLRAGFELGDPQAIEQAEAVYDAIEWTADIQDYRFLCSRALAWDAYLSGDSARAQWLFKDSKDLAPGDAWKVMAHVDRAYVARMNDNEAWALEELERAHSIAEHVSWGDTKSEERVALVTLAILYAPVDMVRAQRYVSTYISMGVENIDPTLAATRGRRTVAFEKYASGCVQQVMGNTALAVQSFETAFEIFSQSEYYYRAAIAANALYEVTKNPTWLETARSFAKRFPQSALSAKLHAPEPDRDVKFEELSPFQRQLAMAVGEGLDVEQLSVRFSRSTYTIERQLEQVLQQTGVSSPAALRARIRERRSN